MLTIWARDTFGNVRVDSVAEVFQLQVTGLYTGTDYGAHASVSLSEGMYQVSFMFEIVEAYEIQVLFNGDDIVGSPVSNIDVLHGLVQALYSDLLDETDILIAG